MHSLMPRQSAYQHYQTATDPRAPSRKKLSVFYGGLNLWNCEIQFWKWKSGLTFASISVLWRETFSIQNPVPQATQSWQALYSLIWIFRFHTRRFTQIFCNKKIIIIKIKSDRNAQYTSPTAALILSFFFFNLFAQIFFHFLWPTINGEKKKMKRGKSWNSIMYTIWMEYLSLWSKN